MKPFYTDRINIWCHSFPYNFVTVCKGGIRITAARTTVKIGSLCQNMRDARDRDNWRSKY